jgi:hypothetical protein
MTDTQYQPFYRSFMLCKTVYLDAVKDMPMRDLEILNIETLAAFKEAQNYHRSFEDPQCEDASTWYRRMKTASYFQAAIEIALKNR